MLSKSDLPSLVLGALLALAGAACEDSGMGSSELPERVFAKNTFEPPRTGDPIANFLFEQFKDNRITLKISNITNGKAVSFTYMVAFAPKEVTAQVPPWTTEGAANLGPGQGVDKGIVARNPAPIDVGTFTITIDNVNFPPAR